MDRERMIEILEEILYVDDEWGGEKLASWKYGNNVVVGGIEDAVDVIIKERKRKFTLPRYDEVYFKGVEWLNNLRRKGEK